MEHKWGWNNFDVINCVAIYTGAHTNLIVLIAFLEYNTDDKRVFIILLMTLKNLSTAVE